MKCNAGSNAALSGNVTAEEFSTYMPLVRREVGRFLLRLPPNVLRDDLIAAGSFGLLDALRKSPDREGGFEWYAQARIRGAILDELRTQDWLSRRARKHASQAGAGTSNGAGAHVGLDDLSEKDTLAFARQEAGAEEQLGTLMERRRLERAMSALSDRDAKIVAWHYFEGVPMQAIAERLGVSGPRVSQLHSRALKTLRDKLVDPRDAATAA